jgi:hypothetical protein
VVHQRAIAWPRFSHLHPFVFGKSGRHHDVLILDGACGRNLEVGRYFENHVGLMDAPTLDEVHRRRHVLRVALLRAGAGPGDQRVDLLL